MSREGNGAGKGLENPEGAGERAQLEKRRLRGKFWLSLTGGDRQGIRLCSQGTGTGAELCQRRVRLKIREFYSWKGGKALAQGSGDIPIPGSAGNHVEVALG